MEGRHNFNDVSFSVCKKIPYTYIKKIKHLLISLKPALQGKMKLLNAFNQDKVIYSNIIYFNLSFNLI